MAGSTLGNKFNPVDRRELAIIVPARGWTNQLHEAPPLERGVGHGVQLGQRQITCARVRDSAGVPDISG